MWVDSCSVDLGTVRAGIRTNTTASAAALERAFAPYVVDDDEAPRNFSVRFSTDPKNAHLLFWGGCIAARSFDPARILRALIDHLGAHRRPPEGLVWVSSLAFVAGGRAVLMPSPFDDDLRIADRQLRQAGWVAVDSPRALVDLRSGELVVAPLLDVDARAVAAATAGVARRRVEPTVPYGRYPIERWVFIDYLNKKWGPISRATATRAAILEILDGIDSPDQELLTIVADMFAKVGAKSMYPSHPRATVDAVLDTPR